MMSIALTAQNAKIDSLEHAVQVLKGKAGVKAMNELASLLVPVQTNKAEMLSNQALKMANRIGDLGGMANAYYNLGLVFSYRERYLKALDDFQKCLYIRKQGYDELGQAQAMIQIGSTYIVLKDLAQAEPTLTEALDLAKKSEWESGMAQAHDLLGKVAFDNADLSKARLNYKAAYDGWVQLSSAKRAAESAKQLAEATWRLGDLTNAESYFDQALDFAKQALDSKEAASIRLSIAKIAMAKNQLNQAEHSNQLAFDANLQSANTLGMAENQLVFGKLALARGNKALCLERFERARLLLENKEPSREMVAVLEELTKTCQQLNEVSLANRFEKELLQAKAKLAEQQELASLKLRHELLLDRSSAVLMEDRLESLEDGMANAKKVRGLMFVLLGLLGLMSALVYIFYKKNVRDNDQLLRQHQEIKQKEAEQAELNKELGIQNLSLELLNKKLVEEIAERENIERSSFARDRFLATMSHEMRNPLNVITGITHLLMEQSPRPDQVDALRTLQFSANELVVFINDVLNYSKIEAGKLDMQGREFDLGETAFTVFNNFEKKALQKKLHFYCAFDNQLPRRLIGDNSRFHQVLNNLLTSCYDSTEEGMVRAEVSLVEQREREIIVKIVVESTDGGLQPVLATKELTWNFAENTQDDLNPRQLSLAITKRLVEQQNGRFEIENLFGEATRYTVFMPFKKSFHLQKNIIQVSSPDYSQLQGAKVLVVEDNKINQLVVAKILRQHGMTVVTADNGSEALEHFELHNFDLVLMDIQMPVMDGYRATAEMRNHPSSIKQNVPIIALTASAFITEKEKAVLFGMTDYVGKPFSPEELLERMASCLEFNKKY